MTKAELIQEVESRQDELVKLVCDLIKIKNENPTGSQEEAVLFIEDYLKEKNIDFERLGENPEFPCLVGKIGREDGYSLIFNGHVDVVPAGDLSQWDFDPYLGEVRDGKILGRGTSDMKAGLAGAMFATSLFKEKNIDINGNIRLHIVSDEESGGEFGTAWLCDNGYSNKADGCIVAEPTSMNTIEIGQKGKLDLTIKAQGRSAHGSLGNYVGENAILKLAKVLPLIEKITEVEGKFSERQQIPLRDSIIIAQGKSVVEGLGNVIKHVTTNIGIIEGGTRPNMVPDSCSVKVDCRLPIGVSHEEIENKIQEIIKEAGIEGITYNMEFKSEGNFTDHEDSLVLAIKNNAESILNSEVIPAYQWASSDARDYRRLGIPTLQFGPSNTEGIHSYNETVDVKDVVSATKTYVAAICDLMGIN